jgi:hypothetical protein
MNCFGRADVDTGLAVHAHVLVDFCLVVLHGNRGCRAFAYAGLASGAFLLINNSYHNSHSMERASAGQTSTHVSQSTHISLSTIAFSLSMAIADAGHSLTHVSHPVHLLLSTTATNYFTPDYMFRRRQKKGFYCDECPSGHSEPRRRFSVFERDAFLRTM